MSLLSYRRPFCMVTRTSELNYTMDRQHTPSTGRLSPRQLGYALDNQHTPLTESPSPRQLGNALDGRPKPSTGDRRTDSRIDSASIPR